MRFVDDHDLARYAAAITARFTNPFVSAMDVEHDVLFEREINGPEMAGGEDFDAIKLLEQLRAWIPERVLRDARWRMFAMFVVGYMCHLKGITDANLALLVLLVVALAPNPEVPEGAGASAPSPPTVGHERLALLFQLLCDLFTSDELQQFIRFHGAGGEALLASLPCTPAGGRANYSFEVLEAMGRRGWIDARLFAELTRERPLLAARIASVREIVLGKQDTLVS